MAVGKHLADLQYQHVARLNGIRWIQSITNLRKHSDRVIFALAFIVTSIMGLIDVEIIVRVWTGRILFMTVLLVYLINAIYDWFAEHKQLQILLKYEEINRLPAIRIGLHKLANQLSMLYGLIEFIPKEAAQIREIDEIQGSVQITLRGVQDDVRAMDPSYLAKKDQDVPNGPIFAETSADSK